MNVPKRRVGVTLSVIASVGAAAGAVCLGEVADGQPICGPGWTQVGVSGPAGRSGHAMAYDSVSGRSVLFGGTVLGVANQETWAYNGSWSNLNPGNRPSARAGMAMAFDPSRNRTVLFSGYSGLSGPGIYGGYENATWEFSTSWATRTLTGPAPRAGHVMAYVPAPVNRTILFGGSNRPNLNVQTTKFSDTWEWNGVAGTWTQRLNDGPSPRDFSAMCYDSARHLCALFAGYTETGSASDTWEYDPALVQWTQVLIPGPPARYDHQMVYDAERQVSVVVGGAGDNFNNEGTWQYAGSPVGSGQSGAWSRLITGASPGPRSALGMDYDTVRLKIIIFGGQLGFSYLGDTWEGSFRNWPVVTTRPLDAVAEPGCGAGFTVSAESRPVVRALTYAWRKDGVALSNDDRITGVTTASLSISGVLDTDAGSYDVLISSGCGIVQSTPANLVVVPLVITDEPTDVGACPDGAAVFSVGASGGSAISYQWRHDGEPLADDDRITGSASPQLTITGITALDTGAYDVLVTTACSAAQSSPASLSLLEPAAIVAQPRDASVCTGSDANLTVGAAGSEPVAYQWQWSCVDAAGNACTAADWVDVVEGDNLNPDTGELAFNAAGAQAPWLMIPGDSLSVGSAYSFRCAVSNPCAVITSDAARIRANSADFNGDGDIGTDADIEAFFACLAGSCCAACGSADFNADGDIGTDADIEAFFRVLAGGPC